jgi:hypothetical protein
MAGDSMSAADKDKPAGPGALRQLRLPDLGTTDAVTVLELLVRVGDDVRRNGERQEAPRVRAHRRLAQLLGVHFPQALEAADMDGALAHLFVRELEEDRVALGLEVVPDDAMLVRLFGADLHHLRDAPGKALALLAAGVDVRLERVL